MGKRIISADFMQFMSVFESVARVAPQDCFQDESTGVLVFIVPNGKIRKALGPKASNVKKLEAKLNKKIKVAEHSDDVKSFIKSLLLPIQVDTVTEIDSGVYQIEPPDRKTRGMIIGRSASNLRNLEKIARRFYDIKEIKVV